MFNNKIKNKVLSSLHEEKLNKELIANKKLEKALSFPEIKQKYKDLKGLEFEKNKKEFLGEEIASFDKQIVKAKKDYVSCLKKYGFSESDFVPNYTCKICGDTGVCGENYCNCFYKRFNQELIKNLDINIDPSHTFENANFELFDNKERIKKLYDKLSKWCDKIGQSKTKTLVLSGNTGVGKTFLTECICNKLLSKSLIVNYYSSFALNDLFYKYHTSFSENRVGLLDDVLNCDVLIVDDFGAEPKIKITEDYFCSLINERLVKNLTTIISTNLLPLQILDRYGERIFSRLNNKASSVMIKMENQDLRLKK